MALRAMQTRENGRSRVGRVPAEKNFYQKPEIRPRAALASLTSNAATERLQEGKAMKAKNPTMLRQPRVVITKEPKPSTTFQPVPSMQPVLSIHPVPSRSPKVEDMEVGQIAEAMSEQLRIDDIDTDDGDNPQLCTAYVKEIYQYMREMERKFHVEPNYFQRQPTINARMRAILIDWLIQVHLRFTLLQETLYLTVSIIDRFLELQIVEKSELQLVGVTAMLIASKYEEMYAPEVRDFVYITAETYKDKDIRDKEREMLRVLEYNFGNPLCLHFLRRFSRAGNATPEIHTMAKFLMELSLPDYTALAFLPSQKAAAALCLAMKLYRGGEWGPTLVHYSSYTEAELTPCMAKMADLVMGMRKSKQQAVRQKYCSEKFLCVAKEARLRSRLVQDLAASTQ